MKSGSEDWLYFYNADDERIWSYNVPENRSRWTLRDLGNQVLREYTSNNGSWGIASDYIYRDGLLLAAETPVGPKHFHLDHLGTPRLITNSTGQQTAYHVYYPFGEEATAFNQDTERMKFTGHERDLASLAGAGDDLDYMHARHFNAIPGKFLSIDPAMDSVDPFNSQTWNRYAYVGNNPILLIDPDGEVLRFFGSRDSLNALKKIVNNALNGYRLEIDKKGLASLVKIAGANPTKEQEALRQTLAGAINHQTQIDLKVVSGDSTVLVGQYVTGTLDIGDINSFGSGPGATSASTLAHEIAEQTSKQSGGFPNTLQAYQVAHAAGIAAQDATAGSVRGKTLSLLPRNPPYNGKIVTEQFYGGARHVVVIFWDNGNIQKVLRQ